MRIGKGGLSCEDPSSFGDLGADFLYKNSFPTGCQRKQKDRDWMTQAF